MSEQLAGDLVETLSMRVARRVRGAIAENRIIQRDLAAAIGMPQPQLSRRVTGMTPFTIDEIERLADVLGVEVDAVLGVGTHEGRSIGRCAIRDSNPEPADSEPRAVLSIVGRRPHHGRLPVRIAHVTPRRHLALVGGAA